MRSGAAGDVRDHALSEVIGFVLLLGLVVAAFSIWMIYIVPVNGRETEISQMNMVKDQFTDYKTSLDSLWVNNQTGVTLSTSFNLGTGESSTQASGLFLPMLKPIPSSATIAVRDPGDTLIINSSAATSEMMFNLSVLEYQSLNNYWIQQRYYYQTGGVFLSQDNGSVCRVSPAFSLSRVSNGSVDVASVNIVPIRLLGGSAVGGRGPVRVDSMMQTPSRAAVLQPNSWVTVSVNVADKPTALMWMSVLNETRIRGNITESSWYSTSVVQNPSTRRWSAVIRITGPYTTSSDPDVFLTLQAVNYVVTLNNIASGLT